MKATLQDLQRIQRNSANHDAQDAIRESIRYDRIAELHPGCEEEFQDLYFALLSECGDDCDMCEIHDAKTNVTDHDALPMYIDAWGKRTTKRMRYWAPASDDRFNENETGQLDTSKWRVWLHAEPYWKCDPDHSAAIDGM